MTDLSFLRPWAALFLIPAFAFCLFRLKSVQNWFGIVDYHLLDRLVVKNCLKIRGNAGTLFLLLCVFSFMAALCGLSVNGRNVSLYHPKSPAVIVLDMSLSMKVRDVLPNRFSRAILKIYDLLDELKGNPVSLIVFTDEPYLLIPPTSDKKVVENILPLLSFNLMPSQGSRIDRALEEAVKTIKSTGAVFGDVFLITDGAEDVLEIQDKTVNLARTAFSEGTRFFILGAGTPQGGGLFAKEDIPVLDALGNPVRHRLKEAYLKQLAAEGGGTYTRLQINGDDIALLMKKRRTSFETGDNSALTDNSLNDTGYLFLILPLMGFPLLFRSGRFLAFLLPLFLTLPVRADMPDAFLSPSAAAMRHIERGETDKAVEVARTSNNFTALYNIGTKLIFLQNYPAAIELLEAAVKLVPEDMNAQINLEIARRLNEPPSSPPPPEGDGQKPEGGETPDDSLNQDNNNDGQGDDNKENTEGDSDSSDGENNETDGEGNNSGEGGQDSSGDGENEANGDPDSSGNNNGSSAPAHGTEGGIVPVHEDPLTLLRHKILFLYQKKRYNDEKYFGAQW